MSKEISNIPDDIITSKIYYIRKQKVMLDKDLAELYGIETKRLKEQVRRNLSRFPEDFMFELTEEENETLRSQIATLKQGQHSKYLPFVFTEHGVLMLSSVLNSERAIQVNIQIMRIYTKLRTMLLNHKDLLLKFERLEKMVMSHDEELQIIFNYLKELLNPPQPPRKKIGFKTTNKKP